MSYHTTLFLTADSEHCYIDGNASYSEGCNTENCIVLEIDAKHRIDSDCEGSRVIIEEGTELYNQLINTKHHDHYRDATVTVNGLSALTLYNADNLKVSIDQVEKD